MKRTKRKYTRKVPTPQADSVKEESVTISHVTGEITTDTAQVGKTQFSYTDLPLSVRVTVEKAIAYRKAKGLSDDSKERKLQAVKYFRGDRPR